MTPREELETLAALIESAARKSIPWPDSPDWIDDNTHPDGYREVPITLERFVNNTYIGEEGANEVFRAAASAAAEAILAARASALTGYGEKGE